jgi:hypothetical protein
MNITAYLQQIIILIHQKSLAPLLEDMAASIVTLVKIDRIARLKRLHHFGEIALRGLQDKVDMVGQ